MRNCVYTRMVEMVVKQGCNTAIVLPIREDDMLCLDFWASMLELLANISDIISALRQSGNMFRKTLLIFHLVWSKTWSRRCWSFHAWSICIVKSQFDFYLRLLHKMNSIINKFRRLITVIRNVSRGSNKSTVTSLLRNKELLIWIYIFHKCSLESLTNINYIVLY